MNPTEPFFGSTYISCYCVDSCFTIFYIIFC